MLLGVEERFISPRTGLRVPGSFPEANIMSLSPKSLVQAKPQILKRQKFIFGLWPSLKSHGQLTSTHWLEAFKCLNKSPALAGGI